MLLRQKKIIILCRISLPDVQQSYNYALQHPILDSNMLKLTSLLSQLYSCLNHDSKSIPLWKQTIAKLEAHNGTQNLAVSASYSHLGTEYYLNNQLNLALNAYRHGALIFEYCHGNTSRGNAALEEFIGHCENPNYSAEGERLIQKIYAIRSHLYGAKSNSIFDLYDQMRNCYEQLRNYQQARHYAAKSLALTEQLMGVSSPIAIARRQLLISIDQECGKIAKANKLIALNQRLSKR